MGRPYQIAAGDIFGRFTVIRETDPIVFTSGTKRQFLCKCKCGTIQPVTAQSLVNGKSQSCGCLKIELSSKRATKHGHSVGGKRSPEHSAWHAMLSRCHNPHHPRYSEWGGRGIAVCDRWRGENGFSNFLADMGLKPSRKHMIDRFPNNDGNYEPGNCRWATNSEQCSNKNNNHLITFNGRTQTLTQWAKERGLEYSALSYRIINAKWPIEKALMTPSSASLKRKCRHQQRSAIDLQ